MPARHTFVTFEDGNGTGKRDRMPENNTNCFLVVAGEVSGDMYAARLVSEIRSRLPDATFFGIGGEHMQEAGVEILHHVEDMSVTGIAEAIVRLPFFRKVFREIVATARARSPRAVILVDYPDFNLRLAGALHGSGPKIFQYVCPQVWAWRRGRIPAMARVMDRLITIFPFEKQYFEGTGLAVDYVGHPLADEARIIADAAAPSLPWQGEPRIALLPGSRPNEVERILPTFWQAAAHIQDKHPGAGFIIAAPSESIATAARVLVEKQPGGQKNSTIVTGQTRHVLKQARAALVASGTATIEAALMECPMAIAYRMAPLTYHLCRWLVRVERVGMVNIVAGKTVCPELIQDAATPDALAGALLPLLEETPGRSSQLEGLRQVVDSLGQGGAEHRAAEIIVRELG